MVTDADKKKQTSHHRRRRRRHQSEEDESTSSPISISPTSPTSPLAPFPPPLPAESRSRAPEFYGFVAWAVTYLLFLLYFLWAILPDEWIVWLGVSWYPNRYALSFSGGKGSHALSSNLPIVREWALLVPAWSIVVALLTYFTYFSMTIRGTPAFSDISTYTGRLVSILPPCLPFLLAKVSTLQIQEGNTRTPVIQIPTLRTPDRMQYRRRMIYRLAWSIVCFTITAPQENRSTYRGNYPSFLAWNVSCSSVACGPADLHVVSDPQM